MTNMKKVAGTMLGGIVTAGVIGSVGNSLPASPMKDSLITTGMGSVNLMMVGEQANLGLNMVKKLKL